MQSVVNIDQNRGTVTVAVEGGATNTRQADIELTTVGTSIPVSEMLSQVESVNIDVGNANSRLEKVMESLSNYPGRSNFYVSFEIDDRTDSVVIKVIDRGTQKVLCQIPPDAILNMKARMRELQGTFYDQQA